MRLINILKGLRDNNRYYNWYILCKKTSKNQLSQLFPYYNEKSLICKDKKIVVCPYVGHINSGGLADRLRGILSTYYICKQLGFEFRLFFINPFNLSDYLVPNCYDWSIDAESVRYDIPHESVLLLATTQDSAFQREKQKQWFFDKIGKAKGQVHVYSTSPFSYDCNYHSLFNELFKPSQNLQKAIDKQIAMIGGKYISISCRFLNMLNDFNETYGYEDFLNDIDREFLLRKIDNQLELLHEKHRDSIILCNSDSRTFLNRVLKYDFTYVVPGEITHIDNSNQKSGYDQFEKTFLDFFMIAHADHIYTLKTGKMLNSGYPYAASFIYEKPYDVLFF